MERISLHAHTPATTFLRHLVAQLPRKATNTLYADVEVTINGQTVSFIESIEAFAASLDEQAVIKAEEIISEAGLAPIVTALRNARVGVSRALKEAHERLRKEVIDEASIVRP